MNDRVAIQREAARRSLQLRRSLSIPRDHPVNVFDIARTIGVEVQFLDLPSLEGMFYRGPDPRIILPSFAHRPRGRVAFSCAHELGHFDLGHGTRVDKYVADEGDDRREISLEELAADTFASTFLMPRPAVINRFLCRRWVLQQVTALQLYQVAVELDVGYGTLCNHLRYGLGLVDDGWLKERSKFAPKALRRAIAPSWECNRLLLVDEHWPALPVDMEIGDLLAISVGLKAEATLSLRDEGEHDGWRIYCAVAPGESHTVVGGRTLKVRIARTGFCGLLKYRYLEQGDEDT